MAKPSSQPVPPVLKAIRMAFPILEVVAPGQAKKLATKLFLTPFTFKFTAAQLEALKSYERFTIEVDGKSCAGYAVGSGPEIILLHGWMGKALQFRVIVDALVNAGYRCVMVDAPGHGDSTKGMSNMFEFADALKELMKRCEQPKAVVGHSLGSAAISYAISKGLKVPAFISLAAPVIAQDILDEYASRINASKKSIDGIRQKAVELFDVTFDSVAMESTFKSVTCPVLALHGDQDLDAPVEHLDVLKEMNPNATTHKLEGIGHRRILKDERTLTLMIDWLKNLE